MYDGKGTFLKCALTENAMSPNTVDTTLLELTGTTKRTGLTMSISYLQNKADSVLLHWKSLRLRFFLERSVSNKPFTYSLLQD